VIAPEIEPDVALPKVWALHDGKIGIINQVVGVAEAVGLPFVSLKLDIKLPWRHVSPTFWPNPTRILAQSGLRPPWPSLVISCGHSGVGPALAIRAANQGRSFIVQVQDPRLARDRFDLMLIPEHDRARGANVLVTRGAVHRVTPAKLREAAERMSPALAALPHPRLAVLIGGNNKVYRLTPERMDALATQLATLCRRDGAALLVTPSRRTGAEGERILRDRLAGLPATIWDGSGENPYFAYLGLADAVLVTEDSVSMVTEASATGKPIYILGLEGGSTKFRRFHKVMADAGITRPFRGVLENWQYEPPADTQHAALELERRMRERGLWPS
jgi:mitochondrial fission protein ELM1